MNKMLFCILVLLLIVPAALAQQTKVYTIDCWSGGWCAMPCGGSGQGNYACSDGTGAWTNTCAYTDSLPTGSTVTKVQATLFTHQCATSTTISPTLNGTALGTITDSTDSCYCLNSPCLNEMAASTDYPAGFPGYVVGGSNTFAINLSSGLLCVEHVEVTVTYTAQKVEIVKPTKDQDFDLGPSDYTATDPITFEAKLTPPNGAKSVDWNVLLEYQTSGGRGASSNTRKFQTQAGNTHDETYTGMGGRLTVNASAVMNNQTVKADPVKATITGVAIPNATITARLVDLYKTGDTTHLMTGIAYRESTYMQFRVLTLYGRSDRWPNESYDGGSHVGLMQMPTTMENAWNWESNTNAGVNLFQDKLRSARHLMRLIINKNKGLRQLTGVELENMALVLYGPYASGNLSEQYYAPATVNNQVVWVVNTAGNADGVAYADDVRSKMQ